MFTLVLKNGDKVELSTEDGKAKTYIPEKKNPIIVVVVNPQ